jgi:hypothetical protein
VQEDRHVVRPSLVKGGQDRLGPLRAQADPPAGSARHLDELGCAGCGPSGGERAFGKEQEPRSEVVQVEGKLFRRVGGIQRGDGRAEGRHGEQELHELRTVREGQRDPVAPLDPEPVETARELFDPARQLGEANRRTVVRGNERRCRCIAGCPDDGERLGTGAHDG